MTSREPSTRLSELEEGRLKYSLNKSNVALNRRNRAGQRQSAWGHISNPWIHIILETYTLDVTQLKPQHPHPNSLDQSHRPSPTLDAFSTYSKATTSIKATLSARETMSITYDGVASAEGGNIFQDTKFWVSHRVPTRSHILKCIRVSRHPPPLSLRV